MRSSSAQILYPSSALAGYGMNVKWPSKSVGSIMILFLFIVNISSSLRQRVCVLDHRFGMKVLRWTKLIIKLFFIKKVIQI